ncbi:MAG: dihydroorotate dehydrogenase 2 [Betaproteobacteria bacterium]|nr:dihydroorotate dehydrogenase 2 [Betaproteobacteria bacterium]
MAHAHAIILQSGFIKDDLPGGNIMSALYTALIRPLMFQLPAEAAHEIGKAALKHAFPWNMLSGLFGVSDPRLHTRIGGLELASPVGLAAGFDKNAEALPGLQHLGFGYLIVGSILPNARPGNAKPRLIRYPDKESLLNCYGLPSDGLERCAQRLQVFRAGRPRTPVIANIDAPSEELYLQSLARLEPHVDAVELGIQCPNNPDDGGEFHDLVAFEKLLRAALKRRTKPLFVKIVSYQDEKQRQNRLELIEIAAHAGVDGITVPGTWRQAEPGLSMGYGHSSGHMVFKKTLETVRDVYAITRGRIAIKANGGVFTGEEAFQVLAAGANTVDVLTSFVYRGWDVAERINRELLALLAEHRVPEVCRVREFALA